MAQNIHVNDDLYFISLIIRNVKDGCALDLDADMFRTKLLNDIAFVDQALANIKAFLDQNERLIDRVGYYRNLLQAERKFLAVLHSLVNRDCSQAMAGLGSDARVSELSERASAAVQMVEEALNIAGSSTQSQSDLVSRDEMDGLLGDLGSSLDSD